MGTFNVLKGTFNKEVLVHIEYNIFSKLTFKRINFSNELLFKRNKFQIN